MLQLIPRRRAHSSHIHLVFISAGFCLLLPVALNGLQRSKVPAPRQAATPANSPSPTSQPSPPVVDFQAVPDREAVEPEQAIQVSLFISNKSSKTLTGLKVDFAKDNFELLQNAALPASLPPFRSVTEKVIIKPVSNSGFGTRKLLLSIEYAWISENTEFVSAQPATATVTIRRRFEEETKGFPGGTAAFFYLLLPIIPAILSYQFFEGLRKDEGPKLPTFKTEYVVPAFLAAVILSLLMLVAFKLDSGLNYSNPLIFMGVLLGSFVAGAVVPLERWRRDNNRRREEAELKRIWGFNNTDTLESYLRKALLAPGSPREFEWAQGTVDGDPWEGVPLSQPDGAPVLGAQLQVSYPQKVSDDQWKSFLKDVINQEGSVIDRQRLVDMVAAKKLQLDFVTRIKHGSERIAQVVVINEVKNWKRAGGQASPLVRPFR